MIHKEKLEELMVRNWAYFLDVKKVVVRVLQDASLAAGSFEIAGVGNPSEKDAVQISLSRCGLARDGFVIWVEFNSPRNGEIHAGTAEYLMDFDGTLDLRQIIGKRFRAKRT